MAWRFTARLAMIDLHPANSFRRGDRLSSQPLAVQADGDHGIVHGVLDLISRSGDLRFDTSQ